MHVKKKPIDVLTFLSKEKFLFIVILFIEFFQFLYCIGSNRLVVHDTFFRFYMQYYYLNNYINYFEYPYWIPYLTHGTLATPWQGLVGIHGILNNVLFLTGSLLKNINFLQIFYTGVYFDKIVLLTGSWLFSRRLYNSPIVSLFVCISILTSSVWASQIHLNFLFYYAIPLIIYLLHRFIETQKWRYFLFGSNLFILQCIDKLFYFLPVVSLTIFLYFFFYTVFNLRKIIDDLKRIRFGLNSLTCIGLVVASILVVLCLVKSGIDGEIVKNILQRNNDGSVPLDIFLTYSKDNSITKWFEVLIGVSIKNDSTLYCGLLVPLFALFGIMFNLNRKSLPIFLAGLVLFLFSLGSIVSVFFYYSWPMMKYYRHIFQITSIVRIFLCFFAGFGLLKLLEFIFSKEHSALKNGWLLIMSTILLASGAVIYFQSSNGSFVTSLIKPLTYDADLNQITANSHRYFLLFKFLGIKYILCSLLLFTFLRAKNRSCLKSSLILLIVFHAADGYSYSLQEFNNRTVALTTKQLQITQFQPIIFNHQRSAEDFTDNNQRQNILTPELLSKSLLSWNIHAFLFNDPVKSNLRTDHWLKSLDQYLESYNQHLHGFPKLNADKTSKSDLNLPIDNRSIQKISGLTEHKIQFFHHAYSYITDNTPIIILSNPMFQGDVLFLERNNTPDEQEILSELTGQSLLDTNERLSLSYTVNHFSSNRLTINTNNTTGNPIWLFYSDVWHPSWKAKINNKDSPVYKANRAYKAVKLNPGPNEILFYFSSTFWEYLTFLIIINSFFWLCYIIYLFKSILIQNESTNCSNNKYG